MIDVDLKFINEGIKQLETETDERNINLILYDIIFSSSRMLLVTKGAEPKTVSESFSLFIEKFINEGLVSNSFTDLVKTAETTPTYNLTTRKQEIIDLANVVKTLYEGMDDSLQFKTQLAKPTEPKVEVASPQEANASAEVRVKDFRGVACPMNFVKTKIELSSLKSGDLLEIWLDDGQPIQNVPGSVRNEGHEVVSAVQEDIFWKVLIKKR
jgi:sulfite reductase (ferredoxin)